MVSPQVRVLLVEDEADTALAHAQHLRNSNFQVMIAEDGQKAVTLLRAKQATDFDVIVSDIRLPGVNGMHVLEEVRTFNKEIPFIFTTAYPCMESAIAGINQGGTWGYLVKPIDPKVLSEKVARAASLHKLQRLSVQAAQATTVRTNTSHNLSVEFDAALSSLWMAYQPIISIRNRRVHAYEALVRNESRTLRSPPDLIEAARALGRLYDLGRAIRSQVAVDINVAGEHLPADVKVFVNINPNDLSDPMLTSIGGDQYAPLLKYAHRIVFEVTERSALHTVSNLTQARSSLRALGYSVAVDDLGQGHAGLNSLVQLDPEYVKLDMLLIRDIHNDSIRQNIVQSMFQLCGSSGMGVIAEGVETHDEHAALVKLGADLLQGYLYARPARNFPVPYIP